MPHIPLPHKRLEPGELPPPPVAWLHPLELLRTAYHAWLSRVATSFLDRREMLAALDRDPVTGEPEFFSVSSQVPDGPSAGPAGPPRDVLAHDRFFSSEYHQQKGVWVDFVADVGDSWEATHAVATLLAQHELKVSGRDEPLPHADLVVLGGDLVYPSPTRDSYRRRTREPIGSAFPQDEVPPPNKPNTIIRERHLRAIPGNHDWYDGLTSFVREFCQGGQLGGWHLGQMRSYFAQKLMPGWWVWGIDIALDTRIDPAQQTYFVDVIENRNPKKHQQFVPGDNVILCTAKPSWLRSSRYSDDAYKNLEFFVRELIERHGGLVRLILSGDLHHYARYHSEDHHHQLITSGSGGSYLMGTHHLPAEVRPFLREGDDDADAAFVRAGSPYPSQSDSRRLSLGALKLAFRRQNIPFCVTIGLISYWLFRMIDRVAPKLLDTQTFAAKLSTRVLWNVDFYALVSALVVVAGCAFFAAAANRRIARWFTMPWGALHGLAQIALTVVLALWLMPHPLHTLGAPARYLALPASYKPLETALTIVADAVVVVLLAGWLGATLVGVYLTVSDRVLRWHQNEVFAAQSLFDYRSFVRIHLLPGGLLRIYPIGLRRVPRFWRSRLARSDSDPHYEPTDAELLPHLIEGPIEIAASARSRWPAAILAPSVSKLQSIG